MTSYLSWGPRMLGWGLLPDGTKEDVGLPQMESTLRSSACCDFPLGSHRMEPTEEMGYPGWNLLKSWATSDGLHSASIYMLLFPLGYPLMEPTEEISYTGWNLLKSWVASDGIHSAAIYKLLFPSGYSQMESKEEVGHPGCHQDWN